MSKPQKGIGERAYEECLRLWDTVEDARDAIDASATVVIYRWNKDYMPSAFYLAKLCKAGADIKYILTGER
jgi:hypothetical protein